MEKQWNEASLDVANMKMFQVWFREDRQPWKAAWDRRDFEWFNRDLKKGAVFNTVAVVKCRDLEGVFERCNTIETPWVLRHPTIDNPDRVLEVVDEKMEQVFPGDPKFRKRSMMVGDVVVCVDDDRHFMCDHNGWAEFRPRDGYTPGPIWGKKEV